nr:uncharacterized protein LOC123765232 [Procambarus clarkii]
MALKYETRGRFLFMRAKEETFKLLAMSPHQRSALSMLVVASHMDSSHQCDDLVLLQVQHEAAVVLPTLVATSYIPMSSLAWDLVPWITGHRDEQLHELVITSAGHEIRISLFSEEERVLRPQRVVTCGVPVAAWALQKWVPRIIYAGGAGAGKIDLAFRENKVDVKDTLQFPPWMKEKKKPCFLSIGCVERKKEVLLGSSEGKIYLYAMEQCVVETVGDKFTRVRTMTVPFPVNSLQVLPRDRGLNMFQVAAVSTSGQAAVLTFDMSFEYCSMFSLQQEKVFEASWCRKERFAFITTLDDNNQLHHWKEVVDEPGKWMPFACKLLEDRGVKVSWSTANPHWLAYITQTLVVLEDTTELMTR